MLEAPTDAADGTNSSSAAAASSNTNNNNTPLQLVPGKTHSIDTQHVIGPPGLPPARHVLSSQHYATAQPMNVLKVLDYNVLAHCYATRQMYPYCPPWALSWEYRRDRILREIRSYRADIVCLQEVQANHFEQFFLPQMQQAGYEGYHKRKTRDTVGDDPDEIDGCATFFRRDRFQLVEHHDIEYNTLARQQVSDRKGLRRLLKGNVAHVLVLEDLPARRSSPRRRRFCVANTHMFWDPDQADVKLWQTWVLMQELEKLTLSRNLPLVLCGDFNSMADSAVYELVTAQQVSSANPDSEDPFSILPSRAHVPQHGWLAHHLPLTSAYAAVGEPKFTNYTQHFVGCLDYVFFSRSHLRLVSCVQMEDEANLREYTALPSPVYPSDHLPLIVEMEFLPDR